MSYSKTQWVDNTTPIDKNNLNKIESGIKNNDINIGEENYDNTKTYEVGDIVRYNEKIYKCITAITTAENFDSSKWEQTNIVEIVQSEKSKIYELIEAISTPIVGEGENITLNDTAEKRFENFDIEGNSEQEATPSPDYPSEVECCGDNINIFDGEVEEGNIDASTGQNTAVTNAWRSKNYLNVKDTSVSISVKDLTFSGTVGGLYFYKSDNTYISNILINSLPFTATLPNETAKVRFFILNSVADINAKIKLEKGSTVTPYSPPNQGCINEVICNKNMFNVSELNDYSYSGIALTKNEGTNKIKLNGTATKNFTIYSKDLNVNRFGIGKKYSLSKDFSNITFNFEVFENNSDTASIWDASITMQKSYTRIRVYIQGKTNTTFNDQEIALQLEEGNATEIVPHQSQSYTIPTQQPMRAIGDIRDTFIKINDKWYERHNITRKILDGTENWMLIDNNSRFAIKITEQKAKIDVKDSTNNLTDCLSNRLINSTQLDIAKVTNGIAFSQWTDTQYLYLPKIKDSVDELKSYLAANETYVDYPLKTPIDIECTEEQSTILFDIEQNAKTYKGVTHIYSNDEVSPNCYVEAVKDLTTLIQ